MGGVGVGVGVGGLGDPAPRREAPPPRASPPSRAPRASPPSRAAPQSTSSSQSTSPPQSSPSSQPSSWADALPPARALYDPANEKDACGVGFIVSVKAAPAYKILADARSLLCNMTHRGAVGADARDGDGAGVMTAVPHDLFADILRRNYSVVLPPRTAAGELQYAVGNVFFHRDAAVRAESKKRFEQIARALGLRVLVWRAVPRDNSILGPSARSKEPAIEQPFIALDDATPFSDERLARQLFLLRKTAAREITLKKWFYVCSLSNRTIVYKGLLTPQQVYNYFKDLTNVMFRTHFALVHSRFSTNTFPSWDRSQPMRWCAHNGEINTLRGNKNWMRAREGVMVSRKFGDELEGVFPTIEEGGSDSAAFDNVLELMVLNGVLTLPEAVMMMIPEAWQSQPDMDPDKRAFYEWASCVMEPWDGPALFTFTDGRFVGASLDRNGLRPCRFYITAENTMICASEVGAIYVPPENVVSKGRLQPGRMLLVDTAQGRVVDDYEVKMAIAKKYPFRQWIAERTFSLADVRKWVDVSKRKRRFVPDAAPVSKDRGFVAFGYSNEILNMIINPMAITGKESLGSMGFDTPVACLSRQPRLVYEYFRQLFAQVTNPPIDPIREEIVMSLGCCIGPEGNLLEVDPAQCNRLFLPSPILTIDDLGAVRDLGYYKPNWPVANIDITFDRGEKAGGYLAALDRICTEVGQAIIDGFKIAVLSDSMTCADRVAVSSLVALGGVHHYLVRNKQRSKIALVVETAEAREVHHFCVLLGYGADAICPYMAFDAILRQRRDGELDVPDSVTDDKLVYNYVKASNDGIRKVMSKMGISTLQSYKGAQIFEALGLDATVVSKCFAGTASRINGAGFDIIAMDALEMHDRAWPSRPIVEVAVVPEASDYAWRKGGEAHINDPAAMAALQDAVGPNKNQASYDAYARACHEQIRACTLRGMLDFKFNHPAHQAIPVDDVEPWTEIVKRFATGAMSYGSISLEAHSALAVAMNRLGGKSNTGEGGEDPERSVPGANGDSRRSAIKQVASGRFGVTSYYLSDAEELQIKMAQGAKPGEGGELPGYKVSAEIAKTRKSTAGVGLISPPPHHDIYSIEDLKQLIYDLKCSNPRARVSVKLVSEVGVGIVASGVAKARADHILISGHDGGTGASRWTGIRYAGLPWELGLAETHQTLVLNDLRGRVAIQTDGQIKTGRDVAIACLLGAEEWGFATTPLIAMGCIMMRKCHLNSCPVGIATQDPELRQKFKGTPEHVINFFYYVAEELRGIMARLGFRTINEMVGRSDMLVVNDALRNPKTKNLDLSPILTPAWSLRAGAATYCKEKQDHQLASRLDNTVLLEKSRVSMTHKRPTVLEVDVVNTDRAIGTTLSYEISRRFGEAGLPENTIRVKMRGSAGQSLGAFLAPGVTLELVGDANDYVGKGLSGGTVVVYPPKVSRFPAEDNIIVGNVCLYGATRGKAFFRGIAAERFCVRNSGALAVVEGVGDHGCEYMTGGRVVVLGATGRNFAAGMSGGVAYVYDRFGEFPARCNMEMVALERVDDQEEQEFLHSLLSEHYAFTESTRAKEVLDAWPGILSKFVKVMPTDYKAALAQMARSAVDDIVAPVKKVDSKVSLSAPEPGILDLEDSFAIASLDVSKLDKVRGFAKYPRVTDKYRKPDERSKDWSEINARLSEKELRVQGARCMDCGVPFCQSDNGCPIGNIIPKWNELVYKNQWRDALDRLLLTNNFPEFTGRVCPAPCEGACVLGINAPPVAIKSIECAIIDRAFAEGWMVPQPPRERTGKRIAIIGSGPAGLAAADQLNKAGHLVTVYDRNDRIGGLLVYGIPNMKLDKKLVQRRVDLLAAEGVEFSPNTWIGRDVDVREIRAQCDALIVATGATWPRDLPIPNRQLDGIHFAMEFLQKNTKSLLDSALRDGAYLSAKDRHVVVIGGGDTGCDCFGTALRHGAQSVTNFELLPEPPASRAGDNPWPQFPRVFRVDYGHAEVKTQYGRDPRQYCVLSKAFVSDGQGRVKGINTVQVDWQKDADGKWKMTEIPGSEKFYEADLVLLAMGFLGPEKDLVAQLQLEQDPRSNIKTPPGKYATSVPGVFAAGDCRRGQSLIVWGINEGRQAAREVDVSLMSSTRLPLSGGMYKRDIPVVNINLITDSDNRIAGVSMK